MSNIPQNANGSATSANSSPVVIASDQATVPVSLATVPSHAVTNAGTFAVQASGTVTANAGTNLNTSALALDTTLGTTNTEIGGLTETAPATDTASSGLNGRLQRIAQRLTTLIGSTIAVSGTFWQATQPVSGTFWQATQPVSGTVTTTPPSNASTNIAQIAGVTTATGTGVMGTGVQRVAIASDNDALTVKQATGSNLHTVVDSGTVTTVSTVTNLSQMGGVAIALNTGTRSTGTQRVTIATDDIVPASQSGTWTVQPGNTANTTAWLTTSGPTTSGGLSVYHLASAATTNLQVPKASAGQLYGWMIMNTSAAVSYLCFHNAATTPTAGASIFFKIGIPAGGAANVEFSNGIAFSTGIAISTVTGAADNNTTAVALNDLIINLFYK
jgi:hypothetical protein